MPGLLDFNQILSPQAGGGLGTGFLDPALAYQAQASLQQPQQQAAPQQNILSQLGGSLKGADYSSLGPMLLALGAGIAGGQGSWGQGIGQGLAGAAHVQQRQQELAAKQQAYELQLKQLEYELQHNRAMEGISQQNANTMESTRTDQIDIRRQAQKVDEAKAGAGFSQIAAAAPQWATARNQLLTEGLSGRWEAATGPAAGVMKNALLGASRITGENPQTLYDTYVPTGADGIETRRQKVEAFEGFMHNLRGISGAYPSFKAQFKTLDFFAPKTPESNPETTTSVPMGGGPQQAQAIPGATSGRPLPSPDKLQILRQYANNPEAKAAFDEIYGAGAADHFLQGGR